MARTRFIIFSVFIYTHGGGGGGLATELCLTLTTSWTVARQAPLSMGLPRQEYWSRLPFPSPGHIHTQTHLYGICIFFMNHVIVDQ